MRLALRELVRRPGRFVTATVILALVAMLVMFLGGLLDGLIRNATGALRSQDASVVVYSESARSSLARSVIDPDTRAAVEAVPGGAATGGLGLVQVGARLPGARPRDLLATALFGYEIPPSGVPEPPAAGEVYADSVLRSSGVEEGTELLLGPARSPVRVVGFVDDVSYAGQGTLWGNADTWREVSAANRPDAALPDGVFQALVVRADDPAAATDLAAAIDLATDGTTDSLTVEAAVEAIPGVSQQRITFTQIIGVTVAIAAVVVSLFFALLTVERVGLYGVLKALGARSRTLFAGLLAQALAVTGVAAAVATALVLVADAALAPGALPFSLSWSRIGFSVALLVVAAVAGCSFSLRRVLRVDPATAIGTGS